MTTRPSLEAALAHRLGSALEARWMVEEVLGRSAPLAGTTRTIGGTAGSGPAIGAPAGTPPPVSDDAVIRLEEMAARRCAGEPLQYVLGSWAFRSLELSVDRRALIPRPETEQVAEVALAEARRAGAAAGARPLVIVDLGTGTGAIALSMAVELTADWRPVVWATDADPDALALASANRDRVGARHPGAAKQVRLGLGPWFDPLPADLAGRVDVVVANPPYVSEAEWDELDSEVRLEPRAALVAPAGSDGTPGMAAVESVVTGARRWLREGGAVVVELAPAQAGPAAALARRTGYRDVEVVRDLAGRDRAVVARR